MPTKAKPLADGYVPELYVSPAGNLLIEPIYKRKRYRVKGFYLSRQYGFVTEQTPETAVHIRF